MPTRTFNRREVLRTAAAAAAGSVIGVPALANVSHRSQGPGPKLVRVPTAADIAKALNTAPKGISEATHKAHLTLWQGYANKTNELRKALAELDTDPKKGNQIYSQTRALKANYAFAYGGYKNHNVYFDTIGG